MADGFLGRWAQRKQAVREGKPLEDPVPPAVVPQPAPVQSAAAQPAVVSPPEQPMAPPPPPPTLEDTQTLTPQSDFQRFMAADVDPDVKNAAMKKLFADPHFNVMDRLDIYIDDYSIPDPLPASMLRKMASAKFLNLFDEEEDKPVSPPGAAAAPAPQPVAAAVPQEVPAAAEEPPGLMTEDHDHTDLRLQQDHAAGPQGSGRGPR